MHEGTLQGILEGAELNPERILHLALGSAESATTGRPMD
jgi:hypothetical protein